MKQIELKPKNNSVEQHLQKVHAKAQLEDLKNRLINERMQRAKLKNELTKEYFYVISMAYFCRTIDNDYIPAELGVIKYSLHGGAQNQLHMHINPGKLPFGLAHEAQRHSKNSHELPIPPKALGLTDYHGIAIKLLRFLEMEKNTPLLLFTDPKDVPKVESMLNAILGNRIAEGMLYVCSLPELFHQLQLAVGAYEKEHEDTPSDVHKAQNILDMDYFSYTSGISCDYHESNELLVHCALSQCMRWSYTISKVCCVLLGIDLIAGRHIPPVMTMARPAISKDDSEDDNSDYDDNVSVDRFTFDSYATDYTEMLPAEVETYAGSVCSDSESVIRKNGLLELIGKGKMKPAMETLSAKTGNSKESFNFHKYLLKSKTGNYSSSSNGRGLLYESSNNGHDNC
ncbi:protein maelstrom homolog [Anopheles moucheti]|uniref:protein maelstrom homolog n=1 Tax=Anopheles moucheti TaxID=186751 RepID=UPI0022F0D8E4|nr:protein maelstrom homolog [Anopheles moucheti]